MDLFDKLTILADSAKYDVACTSSGIDRSSSAGRIGNAVACGICHSFSADGRCVSLLKVLLSNACLLYTSTHPHADHIGGMEEVLRNVETGCVYLPDKAAKSKTYQSLMEYLGEEEIPVETVQAGMRLLEEDDLTVDVVAPLRTDYNNTNNVSAVLRLKYKDKAFLFTGDAEKEAERDILLSGVNIRANVLKVGHHGSDTSSSRGFLRQVSPQYAVISCGEGNTYGHPKPITIETLMSFFVHVYRTDQDGTVRFTTDGKSTMQVVTERPDREEAK